MIAMDRMTAIIQSGLDASPAPETEITVVSRDSQSVRFSDNRLLQNVALEEAEVYLRVVDGGRVGVSATNDLNPAGIARAAAAAHRSARLQNESGDYHLPEAAAAGGANDPLSPGGEAAPEGLLEAALGRVFGLLTATSCSGAGSWRVEHWAVAVGNSRGLLQRHQERRAAFHCSAAQGENSGYAGRWTAGLDADEALAAVGEAVELAVRYPEWINLEPGLYPVVLSPYAVADLVWLLQYMGFGARSVLDEQSFLIGRMGRRVMAETLSIWDDAADPRGYAWPFDWEGTPRQRVNLIKNGVVAGLVFDSWTGFKMGRLSTGHALPAIQFGQGPYPAHLVLEPGKATEEELIASVKRGLYINRFHYTNVVNSREAMVTGMTRDTAWWIENGRVKGRAAKLRFSDSLLRALGSTVAAADNPRFIHDGATGCIVPSLAVGSLKFTS